MEAIDTSVSNFQQTPPRPHLADRDPVRVLVADDDPDMRALIARPLVKRGFRVIEKSDGNELIDYIASRLGELNDATERDAAAPLILITDIRMPGCDGLSVVAGIRRWGWRLPVILVSAIDDPFVQEEMERLSVNAFFQKPFDPRLLAFFIQQLVDSPS